MTAMTGLYHAPPPVDAASLAPRANPVFTGTAAVPAGTATAPGLSMSGDADTGLFSPAADRLALATGGVERMRIDYLGNIQIGGNGIGGERFAINGFMTTGDTAHRGLFGPTGAGTVVLGSYSNSPVELRSNNQQRLRIETDGAVYHGNSVAVTIVDSASFLRLRSFTVATLPSAAVAGRLILVADGSSNRRLAVSDGANWRFPDGALVA